MALKLIKTAASTGNDLQHILPTRQEQHACQFAPTPISSSLPASSKPINSGGNTGSSWPPPPSARQKFSDDCNQARQTLDYTHSRAGLQPHHPTALSPSAGLGQSHLGGAVPAARWKLLSPAEDSLLRHLASYSARFWGKCQVLTWFLCRLALSAPASTMPSTAASASILTEWLCS